MKFSEYVGFTIAVFIGVTVGLLAAQAIWFFFHGGPGQ